MSLKFILEREHEKGRGTKGERQREREREREREKERILSRLSAEPNAGLDFMTLES